jgi:hypothetical protein
MSPVNETYEQRIMNELTPIQSHPLGKSRLQGHCPPIHRPRHVASGQSPSPYISAASSEVRYMIPYILKTLSFVSCTTLLAKSSSSSGCVGRNCSTNAGIVSLNIRPVASRASLNRGSELVNPGMGIGASSPIAYVHDSSCHTRIYETYIFEIFFQVLRVIKNLSALQLLAHHVAELYISKFYSSGGIPSSITCEEECLLRPTGGHTFHHIESSQYQVW